MPLKEYAAADKRWTEILIDNTAVGLLAVLKSMYADVQNAMKSIDREDMTESVLADEFLSQVGVWNQRQIDTATATVTNSYSNVKKVLKAVCVSRVYVLASLRVDAEPDSEINVQCPSVDRYVHETLTLAARWFSSKPSMLRETKDVDKIDAALDIVQRAAQRALKNIIKPEVLLEVWLEENERKESFSRAERDPGEPVVSAAMDEASEASEASDLDESDDYDDLDDLDESDDPIELSESELESSEDLNVDSDTEALRERLDAANKRVENPNVKRIHLSKTESDEYI